MPRCALDIATCMYYTGLDPFTKKPVTIANGLNDRKMQRGRRMRVMSVLSPPCQDFSTRAT